MVDRGNLQTFLQEADAVGLQRDGQEIQIGSITQQILMNADIIRYRTVGADPDLTRWFCNVSFQRVMESPAGGR